MMSWEMQRLGRLIRNVRNVVGDYNHVTVDMCKNYRRKDGLYGQLSMARETLSHCLKCGFTLCLLVGQFKNSVGASSLLNCFFFSLKVSTS